MRFGCQGSFGDEGGESQIRPFPNYSLSLFYRRMLYELLQTLRESLEVARQPPAARNPPTHPTTKPIIDSRGRQVRGRSRLVLGTSWASRAASGCLWPAPGCCASSGQGFGTTASRSTKNEPQHPDLFHSARGRNNFQGDRAKNQTSGTSWRIRWRRLEPDCSVNFSTGSEKPLQNDAFLGARVPSATREARLRFARFRITL